MDEDSKSRLEGAENFIQRVEDRIETVEKLIEHTEKRFDDVKWYFGGAATLFTIGFSVLTLVLSWNVNSEKEGLRNFQTDIRADLGKSEVPPRLEVWAPDGTSLAGREVEAKASKENNSSLRLYMSTILKNAGGTTTGPLSVKLYTNDPIHLSDSTTDEPKYKYEAYLYKNFEPVELPGGASCTFYWYFDLSGDTPPGPGKYASLMKFYYGKGKVEQVPVTIVIK
jgi:hypothetical protein